MKKSGILAAMATVLGIRGTEAQIAITDDIQAVPAKRGRADSALNGGRKPGATKGKHAKRMKANSRKRKTNIKKKLRRTK